MKNLKKLFSLMAVVTLMIMTVAVVTSCSDDDKEPEKVPTYAALSLSFSVKPTSIFNEVPIRDVADITIMYYENGVVKTEKLESDDWTSSKIGLSKMPNTLGIKITMKLKEGVTLDENARYQIIELEGIPTVDFTDQDGYILSSIRGSEYFISSSRTVSKDEFIEAVKNFKYEYVVKVNGYNQVEEVTNPTW